MKANRLFYVLQTFSDATTIIARNVTELLILCLKKIITACKGQQIAWGSEV